MAMTGEKIYVLLTIHLPHGFRNGDKPYQKLKMNGRKKVGMVKDHLRRSENFRGVPDFELYTNEHATEIASDTDAVINLPRPRGDHSETANGQGEITAQLWMRTTDGRHPGGAAAAAAEGNCNVRAAAGTPAASSTATAASPFGPPAATLPIAPAATLPTLPAAAAASGTFLSWI